MRMSAVFHHLPASRMRLFKVLLLLPLIVCLLASEVSSHIEEQVLADRASNAVSADRPIPLDLKGKVFYVTEGQKRTHDLSQTVAFVALAVLFAGIFWGRRIDRRLAAAK